MSVRSSCAVSADGHGVEVVIDEEVEEAVRIGLDDRVGALARPLAHLAVDEGRELVVDAELDAGVGRVGWKRNSKGAGEPSALQHRHRVRAGRASARPSGRARA